MSDKTSEILFWTILGSLSTILIFILFINHIISLYNKKNIEFNTQLQLRKLESEKQILKTTIDVQEETMQKISKELHDNVNQILTLAKLNLNNLQLTKEYGKIGISNELISNAINELTNLSSSLSSQSINDYGLFRTIEMECERIMKITETIITFQERCPLTSINHEDQLVLYRIFQETVRNSITHGKATEIAIKITDNLTTLFRLEISDNGYGFKIPTEENNIPFRNQGIKNMKKRASTINANFHLESKQKCGTKIIIEKRRP